MKKLILLFTMVCSASQLYGMESERGRYVGLGDLPRETQAIIVTYLQTNDSLDGTIAAIKEACKGVGLVNKQLNAIVNEVYGIPKGFTALVHMLADKFNTTTADVASKFNTPMAKKYLNLNKQLRMEIGSFDKNIKEIDFLIQQGADVNYSADLVMLGGMITPLLLAVRYLNANTVERLKLLLEYGADPYAKGGDNRTALEFLNRMYQHRPEYEQVKSLLEEAMMKKQQ